jgi:SNF2 family DNA or RNA helicase
MGLGKTLIALMVMTALKKPKTLLIAPIRVLYSTWPDEIEKWEMDLTYVNCHEHRDGLFKYEADIYGINPESSLKLLQDPRFLAENFDLLVIDESSMYKAYDSRRFKLLQKHLHRFGKRWILTGTPAPNGLMDIWSQIYLLDQGQALGKYITHFRNAFCVPSWDGYSYSLQKGAEAEIYARIKPYILRMDAKDHIDMPELVLNEVPVTLNKEARELYEQMENEFLIILGDRAIMSPNAASAGMRCRQIANGGVYDELHNVIQIHNAKTEALSELVEELQGQSVLVFYEFVHDRERIMKALPGAVEASPENIRLFQQGKVACMVAHPASAGYGLNLQDHCHTVVWYGIPWDLGAYDQAIARVWRSGQKSTQVIVHHIVAKDTLDTVVLTTLGLKARTQKTLLDAMKGARK